MYRWKVFHSVLMSELGDHSFFHCFFTVQCLCRSLYAVMGKEGANRIFPITGQVISSAQVMSLWSENAPEMTSEGLNP